MEEAEYQKAYEIAAKNLQAAVQNIPQRLITKAENFCERIQVSKGDPLKKLHVLYDFMNEIYGQANGYIACRKGCNHCCHYNVVVTELEVQFIEKNSTIKRNEKDLTSPDFHGTPCPLLEKGICTIYEARPFACRRRVAMTESSFWCKPDIVHDHELPMIHFEEIDKSFDLIVLHSRLIKSADIREFF